MKLKNKKIILLSILSIMGVGMLTFIDKDNNKTKDSFDTEINNTTTVSEIAEDNSDISTISEDQSNDANVIPPDIRPSKTSDEMMTPTPTPKITVTKLKKTDVSGINQLMLDYFAAKLTGDTNKLTNLLSDPTKVMTEEQLKNETKYIEDYRNIQCYTKDGIQKGAYVLYVSVEIKYININTTVPTIRQFYLVTDEEGKQKIYSDEMNTELKEFYEARNMDSDVQDLFQQTNDRVEKAIKEDKNLKEFWSTLEELMN
jgi:hypothetical protein